MRKNRDLKPRNNRKGNSITIDNVYSQSDRAKSDYPVFSFSYLDKAYHLEKCEGKEKIAFIERLVKLSTMTWQEIYSSPKHEFGTEKISWNAIRRPAPPEFSDR